MPTTIEAAADAIFNARDQRCPIKPIRETFDIRSATDAYAVQNINTLRHLKNGRVLSGRKIGLTAKSVQRQMGVDEPDFGMLWRDTEYRSGTKIPADTLIQPRIEGEIAFILEREITDPDASITDLIRSVAYALPAIEIVDSAIANWDIQIVDTIADNASAAGYVLGHDPKALDQLDLRLCGMVISNTASGVLSVGAGVACLDHPLYALQWLARKMITVERPLQAGDLVLSGALGPMVTVTKDSTFLVEIQGFSPLTLSF
ncbi:MAG: 2-keto-4-pentenoate hydratase [Rhizobiales bacterium]|nr:2-keto-4-pentenoate hydratase [Hyphomicrobiales bacterium]OJY43710.1 MAG: 2-keto-4-pentenoate hydratase [Rhizobiales bacterium 64-17]